MKNMMIMIKFHHFSEIEQGPPSKLVFWNEMLVKTSTNVEPSSSSDEEYDDYDQIPSESTSEICEVMLKLNLKSNKKFRFI